MTALRTNPSRAVTLGIATTLLVAGVAVVYALSYHTVPSNCSSPAARPSAESPIQHVFFLIKENHAFENYFGSLPGVVGYPPNGTFPVAHGSNATVQPFALAGRSTPDLPHDRASDLVDQDGGRNDLFVAEASAEGYPTPSDAVGYYTSTQIPDYYAYARNYTLADMFFSGVLGPTLPNRLFDLGLTNVTWSSDLPPPASAVRGPTLPGQFDSAGLPWDYFYSGGQLGLPTSYLPQIAGNPCLASRVLPVSDLRSVLAGPDPPAMAYIDPENDLQYSEHPPANVTLGDQWTVSVVNSIFESPIGNSSAIFFFYDENGGFWDPVPPGFDAPQGDGFRVPLLVLSPWTPAGSVTNQVLDPANLLRWTESNWGLGPLTPQIANATLPSALFNFSLPARPPVLLSTPINLPSAPRPVSPSLATNRVLDRGPAELVSAPAPGHGQLLLGPSVAREVRSARTPATPFGYRLNDSAAGCVGHRVSRGRPPSKGRHPRNARSLSASRRPPSTARPEARTCVGARHAEP